MAERKFDKVFGAVIWGFMLFVVPFCAVWWTVYSLTKDITIISLGCFLGAAAGIILNVLFLKKLAAHPYSQRTWVSILLLMLYSAFSAFLWACPCSIFLTGCWQRCISAARLRYSVGISYISPGS